MGSSLSSNSLLELEAIVAEERVPIEADNPDFDTMSCSEIAGLVGIGAAGLGFVGGVAIFMDVKSHQVQNDRD